MLLIFYALINEEKTSPLDPWIAGYRDAPHPKIQYVAVLLRKYKSFTITCCILV